MKAGIQTHLHCLCFFKMDVDHIAPTRIDFVDLTQDIPSPAVVDEQSRLLQNINKALTYDAGKEVLAVGGTIHPDKHHPIDIRFDRAGETICKATLPLTGNQDQELAFGALLQACKPATFGKGKVDVLDETYRKAGALDERLFSTSFNLAQYDILETVTQVLVQGQWHGGVTAEMYKLNVRTGARQSEMRARLTYNRSTPVQAASSSRTLILLVGKTKSALWWSVSHVNTKVVLSLFAMMERKSSSTGHLKASNRSNGLHSSQTASTKSWKSPLVIASR